MTLAVTLHHTSFPVTDLARSRAFYEGILGLAVIERPDIFGVAGVWYQAGSCQVHLIEVPADAELGGQPADCDPRARHAGFAVDDYTATVTFLRGKGLDVFETSVDIGQCWVQDPDGHVIEFIVAGQTR